MPKKLMPLQPVEPDITAFNGDYRFLSNFWKCPVVYDGMSYPTSENAYQAAKTLDREARYPFLTMSAAEAKKAGRSVDMRVDWELVKERVMTSIVMVKFWSSPELAQRLVDTGSAKLIEGNHWGDRYWGVYRGQGENRLGLILMGVRESLQVMGGYTVSREVR